MRTLLFWQMVVTVMFVGIFISPFTLLGGWDQTEDPRIAAGILSLIPVIVLAYILNWATPKRLISLVTGLLGVCVGLFAPAGGWVTVVAVSLIGLGALVWEDYRQGTYFESGGLELPAFWTVATLSAQFLLTSATVAAVVYNIPVLLLVWLAVPASFLGWAVNKTASILRRVLHPVFEDRALRPMLVVGVLLLLLCLVILIGALVIGRPPATVPMPADPREQELIEYAKADLAALGGKYGLEYSQIRLVIYEQVNWSDSSVGCPKPGMMYLQVITPGYRIHLWAQGHVYRYHGADGKPPFLCLNSVEPIKGGGK